MRVKLITLLLGAAALALVVGVYTRLERYSETIDRGYAPAARQNPYLAAQMLAERHGRSVTSHASLSALDQLDQYDTLFLSRSSQIISEARLQALLDWIGRGGRLVVAASYQYPWHSDILLEHFQLSSTATHYYGEPIFDENGELIERSDAEGSKDFERRQAAEALRERLDDLRRPDADEPPSVADLAMAYQAEVPAHERLTLDWEGVELTVRFDPGIALEHPWFEREFAPEEALPSAPTWFASGAQGVQVAGFEWGRGKMIVLSDSGPFSSALLDKFDHAELWRLLIGEGERLAIIYGAQVPSLWTVLLRYMPEALLAFALWLSLWLWRQSRRFGPLLRPQETVRRSRLEHIAARADYLWRGRWHGALLAQARQDLLQRARQAVPDFTRLAPDEQCAQLARLAQLNTAAVERTLNPEPISGDAAFVETVQLLQRIRNAI